MIRALAQKGEVTQLRFHTLKLLELGLELRSVQLQMYFFFDTFKSDTKTIIVHLKLAPFILFSVLVNGGPNPVT